MNPWSDSFLPDGSLDMFGVLSCTGWSQQNSKREHLNMIRNGILFFKYLFVFRLVYCLDVKLQMFLFFKEQTWTLSQVLYSTVFFPFNFIKFILSVFYSKLRFFPNYSNVIVSSRISICVFVMILTTKH